MNNPRNGFSQDMTVIGNGNSERQHAHRKRMRLFNNSLLGIGAELLYACGFILIGFLISMLAGW